MEILLLHRCFFREEINSVRGPLLNAAEIFAAGKNLKSLEEVMHLMGKCGAAPNEPSQLKRSAKLEKMLWRLGMKEHAIYMKFTLATGQEELSEFVKMYRNSVKEARNKGVFVDRPPELLRRKDGCFLGKDGTVGGEGEWIPSGKGFLFIICKTVLSHINLEEPAVLKLSMADPQIEVLKFSNGGAALYTNQFSQDGIKFEEWLDELTGQTPFDC